MVYNWQNIFSILGAIIFLISAGYFLFFTDNEVHYIDKAISTDKTLNNTPSVFYVLSYTANNEFTVGQTVYIEAYILFINEQAYNKYKQHTDEKVKLFITGTAPSDSRANWFEDYIIEISDTDEPLRKELQAPYIFDKYLKGMNEVVFQESGTHEIYTLNTTGNKFPLSNINISPRTINYEIKNNKYTIFLSLIGIIISFLSIIIRVPQP